MPFKKPHQISDSGHVDKDGSGGFVIRPKGFNIVWGNDPRYWRINSAGNAELIQVSWLEVSGQVPVQKGKSYTVKFYVKVKADGFGWNGTEVLVMAKVGKRGQYNYKEDKLSPEGPFIIPTQPLTINVAPDEKDPELHFGLYEVWSGKWKGGLEIEKAEIIAN